MSTSEPVSIGSTCWESKGSPLRARIAATSDVVVVLPALPVMPIIRPLQISNSSVAIEPTGSPQWIEGSGIRHLDAFRVRLSRPTTSNGV